MAHELTEKQMESAYLNTKNNTYVPDCYWRLNICFIFFFKNPTRMKSSVSPGQPSTSTAMPDRIGKETMLCDWWHQKGVQLIIWTTSNKWTSWRTQSSKHVRNRPEDTEKLSYHTKVQQHMTKARSRIRSKNLGRSCYSTGHIHHTWCLLTTFCFPW